MCTMSMNGCWKCLLRFILIRKKSFNFTHTFVVPNWNDLCSLDYRMRPLAYLFLSLIPSLH